jgi:hypothetical protein
MESERQSQEGFDRLDELLAKAQWPEITVDSTRRLGQYYADLRRNRLLAYRLTWLAAAAVMLAAIAPWSLQHRLPPTPVVSVAPPNEHSRPATDLELAMLRICEPAEKGMIRVVPTGVPLFPLVTGWPITLPAVTSTQPSPSIDEQTSRLFAQLGDPHIAVREAAADELARIDGPAVTSRLAEMAEAGVFQREAVAALVRIKSPEARRFVAAAIASTELGPIVRSALLQSGNINSSTGAIQ